MNKFNELSLEDFRIYLVVGSIATLGWISLPLVTGMFSADSMTMLNAVLRIVGQVVLLGLALPLVPPSWRFSAILVFVAWLTPVANEIFDARCDLVMARFSFSPGGYPSCMLGSSI